jgi:hypothetical protein
VSRRSSQDNEALLRALQGAAFEFAIIGGVAAVLHGASRLTIDLDLAAPFDDENLRRLLRALAPFHPVHATRPDLSLSGESLERLRTFRLLLIECDIGRLDVLREVPPLGEFEQLRTVAMDLLGVQVRVLARDQLISVKRAVGRPRDIEVALELEAIAERERS